MGDGKNIYMLTGHGYWNQTHHPFLCFCKKGESGNSDHVCREVTTEKYKELINDPEELKRILNKGKLTAEEVSKLTLKRVKDALGFYSTL